MKKVSLFLILVILINIFTCVETLSANDGINNNTTVHLTGISNATSGIYVEWDSVSGATGYRVYRRGAGQTTWTYLTTVKNTYFLDNAVVSGNYYRYTVRAVLTGGFGGFENGIYIKRLANPYSIKVSNVTLGVNVAWGKVNGASCYYVYRRAAGENKWTRIASVSSTVFVDMNVNSNTYYKYTVRAVSGNTLSYFYDGTLVKYVASPKISHLMTGNDFVAVYWNSIIGSTGYRVYRRTAGEMSWTYLATVSSNGYVDSTIKKNNYYRYTIRAQSGNYCSSYFSNGPVIKYTGIAGVVVKGDSYVDNNTPTSTNVYTTNADVALEGTTSPINVTTTSGNQFSEYAITSDGVLTQYYGASTNVIIPAKVSGKEVTAIGANCFKGTTVERVTIPGHIKSIGDSAFEGCTKLTSVSFLNREVDIPIGNKAFKGCTKLTKIALPIASSIGASAFEGCTALTSVDIKEGTKSLGQGCFAFCTSLTKVIIRDTDTVIPGVSVFAGCNPNLRIQCYQDSDVATSLKNLGLSVAPITE